MKRFSTTLASLALIVVASVEADAASYGEYCANIHTVRAREDAALRRGNPELAHNFRYAMYDFTTMRANTIGENRSEADLFADCLHDEFDSRSGAYAMWSDIKHEMTTNPCGDGQTFVYGNGCVSNDTAAILNELKRR